VDGFPAKFACTTTTLEDDGTPQQYDPQARWGDFGWVMKHGLTNSAAAATALYTGRKVKGAPIAMESRKPLITIGEIAKARGKSVGDVTTVYFSDATPGALAAHSISRVNRAEIANEMINGDTLDVLMGCGSQEYDQNGKERPADARKNYQRVGGKETLDALKAGTAGGRSPWTFIQTKADFEKLAEDPAPPRRVMGLPQCGDTLQDDRDGDRNADPFVVPLNTTVPSLATMARGALNVLSRNPRGFFLMLEGGAVDQANHDNHAGRMIEEQVDFMNAVEAVVQWVDAHSSWDETLVIITADHETGFVWGPNAGAATDAHPVSWDPIQNHGKGNMPGCKYFSKDHTGALVPLFAKGRGSELFDRLVKGADPVYGRYVDNTDVFKVMNAEMGTGDLETPAAAGTTPSAATQPEPVLSR
jgi:alkaline phosphatase